MKPITSELILTIHCHNVPSVAGTVFHGLRLGIQRDQQVIEDVPADGSDVAFRAPITVKHLDGGGHDFAGKFVHGPKTERFFYLNWGAHAPMGWHGVRRAKLQLRDMPSLLAERTEAEVWINMTDAKGCPLCATIKPSFIRWGE
ncbi:MAG: DUF5990 family protein [Chthonomonadales bacterium]